MKAIPKISICIPTYNRCDYLLEAINSILCQITKDQEDLVEICVSDNNSTDETDSEIKKLIAKSKVKIKFKSNGENLGADRNYLSVIQMAEGDYCLFLGSDDALVDECIQTLIDQIQSCHGVYLFNRLECDGKLNVLAYKTWLNSDVESGVYNFRNKIEFDDYCSKSTAIGSLFSYISCICFKRSLWNEINVERWLIGTAYVHTYILLKMCFDGASLKYISQPLVKNRGGNDSFLEIGSLGRARRIMLDISGYQKIAVNILNNNQASCDSVFKVLKLERPTIKSALVVRAAADKEQWVIWSKDMMECGYNPLLVKLIGSVRSFAKILINVNHKFKCFKIYFRNTP